MRRGLSDMAEKNFVLPYGRQSVDEDDIAAVVEVLRGDWLTQGPAVAAFESALGSRVDARHVVACTNGTAALHLTALALKLGPGDVAVVPTMTFLATANAARYVGAEVVFADVDPETGLCRPEDFATALERPEAAQARALFPVHYAGQCCDMESVGELARARGLRVVEDACHALGTTYRARAGGGGTVGDCRWSDMAIFSFHPVKMIAMGEGGAVTTNDAGLAERLALLRSHGMHREPAAMLDADLARAPSGAPNPWYYEMPEVGFNYRVSDINCALGMSQLRKFERFAARRREIAAAYDRALAPLSPVVRPLAHVPWCDPVLHLYPVRIDFAALKRDRAAVMQELRAAGVGTQVHYLPVHMQPYYRERYGRRSLPGAEAYYASTLSLPLFPGLDDDGVNRVVDALTRLVNAG